MEGDIVSSRDLSVGDLRDSTIQTDTHLGGR